MSYSASGFDALRPQFEGGAGGAGGSAGGVFFANFPPAFGCIMTIMETMKTPMIVMMHPKAGGKFAKKTPPAEPPAPPAPPSN